MKWAAICALQASVHLSGATRSVELAAIGRRVCESEWDLFVLLGVQPPADLPEPVGGGRTATALRPSDSGGADGGGARVRGGPHGAAARVPPRFEARVARNALGIVERELRLGPSIAAAHAARLAELGYADDAALAAALRAGDLDTTWRRVAPALAAAARDQLLVANPSYLPAATA